MKNEIPLFKVYMSSAAAAAAFDVLNSGYIGEGPKVKQFEKDLNSYFSKPFCIYDTITCNSATSAEHLIYHMLKKDRKLTTYYEYASTDFKWGGLDHKSEVISTPLTCTATNWPILHNNLKLIWADIDPMTMNISLESVERLINEHTRIITIVHWGGYPVDMDKLSSIVNKAEKHFGHKILIVEDCAHAFGSTYKDYNVGFTGNLSTFSTQAIKHLTTVDGGFIGSPFVEFTKAAKLIRWYGIDRDTPRTDFRCEQDIPEIGFKFHMNDVNASIGIENLKNMKTIVSKHQLNAEFYNKSLKNTAGVTLLENAPDRKSSYWLYTMRVGNRAGFMKKMHDAGIITSRVHERNDLHSGLKQYNIHSDNLPNLEMVTKDMICIPVGWWVTPEQVEYISNTIKSGW